MEARTAFKIGISVIRNYDIARQISEMMLDVFRRLGESTRIVEGSCSTDEFVAYNKAVGRVLGPIVMEILEPL